MDMAMGAAQNLNAWYGEVPRDGALVGTCKMHLPAHMEGMTVLDIGCRSGKGVFKIAERVGENGRSIGLDWDAASIENAILHEEDNAAKLGYANPNTVFCIGYPEDLAACGIEANTVDVVIINCVLNLVCNREQTLREIFRVLRPGGLLYHATAVASSTIPENVMADEARAGDPVGSAFTEEALDRLLDSMGFSGIEHPEASPLLPKDFPQSDRHGDMLGSISFSELTVSARKPA